MSQISPPKSSGLSTRPSNPNFWQQRFPWLYALWKFSRPHTIIGTSLSVWGVYFIALSEGGSAWIAQPFLLPALGTLLWAWLACLAGNVYIVGLNQLEDVNIDRVNKPHLPLASGEFSRQEGWSIVAVTGALALALSFSQGVYLTGMVWLSLLIGTAYSLPPIRLKRFPLWASLCIFSVRGAIVNLGLFLHFNQRLNLAAAEPTWQVTELVPPTIWALTGFILVYTFAIAIFKDIPDLEGDRRYHITTFTIRLGPAAVFNLARGVITTCYLGMILAGVLIPSVNTSFLISTHAIALLAFWGLSWQVDLQDKAAIARFYQFIWKLFFLEYLMFPAACLLG